ncbi:3'(2'),5'-bisphosphate nucleotidase 1-like isoform X2 [Artemia franciscana]|uniref:3'(2'),5'-bisphosphate nucleotidase 1 n=1 Tax=Artemia franciscana TaxID=6661 RepID=A0AA88HBI0_ARTSF|nr:hypothetical protein QYM36_016100 [Artemia franciscana]
MSVYMMNKEGIDMPVILRLISSCVGISKEAGKIIRDIMYKGELGVIQKGTGGENDPQTEADRQAQKLIISVLTRDFPKLKIVGEEDDIKLEPNLTGNWISEEILSLKPTPELETIKEEELTVWVDPLDGTTEFTWGAVDHVTVLIGVAYKDRPIGGVIHQPFYKAIKGDPNLSAGRTLWAIRGLGYGGFEAKSPPENELIIAGTKSHKSVTTQKALESTGATTLISHSGAGAKAMLVLEGKAHCYLHASPGLKRWDTCAPEAILTEIGGKVTDILGDPYNYAASVHPMCSRGAILAHTPTIHASILSKLPDDVKDIFRNK